MIQKHIFVHDGEPQQILMWLSNEFVIDKQNPFPGLPIKLKNARYVLIERILTSIKNRVSTIGNPSKYKDLSKLFARNLLEELNKNNYNFNEEIWQE